MLYCRPPWGPVGTPGDTWEETRGDGEGCPKEEPADTAKRIEDNTLKERDMEDDPQKTNRGIPPKWGEDFAKNGAYINGVFYKTREEAADAHWRAEDEFNARTRRWREEWAQSPEGKLCLDFYRSFQEYKAYLEQHPNAGPPQLSPAFPEHKFFLEGFKMAQQYLRERREKDIANLRRASLAARCRHLHADGRRCGSPRMKGKKLCYTHERMEEARATRLDLGLMEDPESIQLAIMKLQRAVIDGTVCEKQTGRLAYLIQLAAWNVTRTRTAQRNGKEERS